jgi:hypothetical protein
VSERFSLDFFFFSCGDVGHAERMSAGLQAKHDAGKLVLATAALLVASLSNLLVVGTCHLMERKLLMLRFFGRLFYFLEQG